MPVLTLLTGPVGAARSSARAAFARLLAERLGRMIEIRSTPTYADLLEMVADGEADFAWLPPAVYVRAEEVADVQLLLAGVRSKRAHFRGALFARSDGSLRAIEDARGARVAWVDRNSCAGFLFPRLALADRGLDPDTFFQDQRYFGDHLAVVKAVMRGDADVGATFLHKAGDGEAAPVAGTGWELVTEREAMRALLVSGPIPSDTLVATGRVDVLLRERFTEAVQSMHDAEDGVQVLRGLFGVQRFEPVLPTRYQSVRDALRAAA